VLTVSVEIPGRARPQTCVVAIDDLTVGDRVVVESEGRTILGAVVRAPVEAPWPTGVKLPTVVARALHEQEDGESHAQRQREDALSTARRLALELQLPMRILRAEAAPAGRKITFQFVAEGRVDFRELVRELARRLRARVELRQIGVRDAAVIQGGVGHCGQPLCCSTFLPGFAPVSMRMAKAQGLPLNPGKISGQCGRLMCCLRYELGPAEVTPGDEDAGISGGSSGVDDPASPSASPGGPAGDQARPGCCGSCRRR